MNKLGKIGEDTATRYLEKMKYTILKRNYRNRRGEIDIIASYNRTLVIVEVKARSNNRFGNPIDAIDEIKINKIKEIQYVNEVQSQIAVSIYDEKEAESIYNETVYNLKSLNVKLNKKIPLFLK